MVTEKEIDYYNELQENTDVESLRSQYADGIIIWINGSGSNPSCPGCYRYVLDYNGHVKYTEKELPGATANQAMIIGATDAINCITAPKRIYLVSGTALGFAKAFKGKGVNEKALQELLESVKNKNCQLTEVQFYNGADKIRKFVYECNPNRGLVPEKKDYKTIVFEDCLKKVTRVLEKYHVDSGIIAEVNELKPWQ